MKGLIFNIQRYSLHDGEGIRTMVFFKGCPLHCPWCCNPESQSFNMEMAKIDKNCIHCSICKNDIEECPSGALVEFGKYLTVDEVIKEVERDEVFYSASKGGVTLSGGEVLSQSKFALELLKRLKSIGINTAIETSGQGKTQDILALSDFLDLILFDLKIMDKDRARGAIGIDMDLVKNNIKLLVKNNKKVIPRVPLIPGYTMDYKNIQYIIDFVMELKLKTIHILPFHQYGSSKYKFLKRDYKLKDLKPPSEKEVESIKSKMEQYGLKVVVAG